MSKKIIVFDGINYVGGLIALAAAKSGISIKFKNINLDFSYKPEITNYYPWSILNAGKAVGKYNFLKKNSSFFPHLFYPQRVIVLKEDRTISSNTIAAIDKILGRGRETATLAITSSKYPDFHGINKKYSKGWLVYEYLFDRNSAIIELLKLCLNEGAEIVTETAYSNAFVVKCLPYNRTELFSDIEGKQSFYKNTIRIYSDNCELNILRYYNGISLQKSSYNIPQDKINTLLDDLKLSDYNFENTLPKEQINNNSNFLLVDSALSDLKSQLKDVVQQLNCNINLNSIFKNQSNPISSEEFLKLQNECNEKFDLAKQTGIQYEHFLHLFYRYRHYMDDFTESAYSLMNKERNPEIIWDKVINRFQQSEQELFKVHF